MDMHSAIRSVARSVDLDQEQMNSVMRIVMQGDATPAQIGAFLTALHIKGETVDELTAAAIVMREFAAAVSVRSDKVVDTVGTGGDAAGLFNVSTAAALVAAAAGITVAKHGNRAATGKSGSADVLEAAGVRIDLTPDQVGETIDHVGIGSDYDGVGDTLPYGLKDVTSYPNLIYHLLKRGYSEEDIEKICYKNVWRVWSAVELAASNS